MESRCGKVKGRKVQREGRHEASPGLQQDNEKQTNEKDGEMVKLPQGENLQMFVIERREALLSMDEGRIRRFCKKYRVHCPRNDRIFWGGVYKAICNMEDVAPRIKDVAREGLRKMGWSEDIK
jgi:hypothetical protein